MNPTCVVLIQSASVRTTVFHSVCNVIHRLLRKEFRSQGIRLRSGCRSSGSLPVKPEALTHLRVTSALRSHHFQIFQISPFYSDLSPQLQAKSNNRGTKYCLRSADIALCRLWLWIMLSLFLFGDIVLNINTDVHSGCFSTELALKEKSNDNKSSLVQY